MAITGNKSAPMADMIASAQLDDRAAPDRITARGGGTMTEALKQLTDDQLAFETHAAFGSGGGAALEAMRRLRDSLDAVSQANSTYARRIHRLNLTLIILIIVLLALTALQAIAEWPTIRTVLPQ
jgi:hypothetical protein